MMQVPTVKQALRYAVADTKGTGILPGLCLPKKVNLVDIILGNVHLIEGFVLYCSALYSTLRYY